MERRSGGGGGGGGGDNRSNGGSAGGGASVFRERLVVVGDEAIRLRQRQRRRRGIRDRPGAIRDAPDDATAGRDPRRPRHGRHTGFVHGRDDKRGVRDAERNAQESGGRPRRRRGAARRCHGEAREAAEDQEQMPAGVDIDPEFGRVGPILLGTVYMIWDDVAWRIMGSWWGVKNCMP